MGKTIYYKTSTETIEKQGTLESIEPLEKSVPNKFAIGKTKYKRFDTYLDGKKRLAKNMEAESISKKEFYLVLEQIRLAFKALFQPNEIRIESLGITRDGHSYDIHRGVNNDYRVYLYDGDSPIVVDKEKINFILDIIKTLQPNTEYKARYFFNKIIAHYQIGVDADAFSGGVNRAKFYFPLYLCPLKIIEKEFKLIKVKTGKGGGILVLLPPS